MVIHTTGITIKRDIMKELLVLNDGSYWPKEWPVSGEHFKIYGILNADMLMSVPAKENINVTVDNHYQPWDIKQEYVDAEISSGGEVDHQNIINEILDIYPESRVRFLSFYRDDGAHCCSGATKDGTLHIEYGKIDDEIPF